MQLSKTSTKLNNHAIKEFWSVIYDIPTTDFDVQSDDLNSPVVLRLLFNAVPNAISNIEHKPAI